VAHNYDPLVERNPMKRIGTAEDVGGLAIFLSSRAGNFTVGETIICDGGLTASSGHDLRSE
jgi:2-deoxy-D-gluconate 3-dehydrogenase